MISAISTVIGIFAISISTYTLIRVISHRRYVNTIVQNIDKTIEEIERYREELGRVKEAQCQFQQLVDELTSVEEINPLLLEDVNNYKKGEPLVNYKDNNELLSAVIDYCFTEMKEDGALKEYIRNRKDKEELK